MRLLLELSSSVQNFTLTLRDWVQLSNCSALARLDSATRRKWVSRWQVLYIYVNVVSTWYLHMCIFKV